MPTKAKAAGEAGALAFVSYYVDLINHARDTGTDAGLLEHASFCQGCANFASLYERTYRSGGYFKGSSWSIRAAIPYSIAKGGYQVLTVVNVDRGTYRESLNSSVEQLKRSEMEFRFVLVRKGDDWSMREMQSTKS
jgi:hypothetical protein